MALAHLAPEAELKRLNEDAMWRALSAMTPVERKAALLASRAQGMLTGEQVAFWCYVWGLRDA